MASYVGSIIVARSDVGLAAEPAIEGFGLRHLWLRDLGDGWQALETSHPERFDFVTAAREWTVSTERPVLAMYVAESFCTTLLGASPGADNLTLHLPDPTRACSAFQHPCTVDTVPTASEAVTAMAGWARSAGLCPDEAHLAWVMSPDPEGDDEDVYVTADMLAFELILALGFTEIPLSREPLIDPTALPYSTITARNAGLATLAWAEHFHAPDECPVDAWVPRAMELERRIWRAAFTDPAVDVFAMIDEISAVVQAHADARTQSGDSAANSVYQMMAQGTLRGRERYDWRPEEHPVRRLC